MKRQRRKTGPNSTQKRKAPAPKPKARSGISRRQALGMFKVYGTAAAIVGLGGWYFAGKVMAGIDEADLSKLGNGLPAIVQVHDPECPDCRSLQRQTRLALEEFDDGTYEYLVANLKSPEGRAFANRHQAGRVTLILFDGRGRARNVIQGRRTRDALVEAFGRHFRRYGASDEPTG